MEQGQDRPARHHEISVTRYDFGVVNNALIATDNQDG